jgi:hypothetical protein
MIKSKALLRYMLFLAVFVTYIITVAFFIDWNTFIDGYKITVFLPVCFLFCFFFLLWDPFFKIRSPFVVLFCIIAFVRYVLLSILTLLHGDYQGISGIGPSNGSLKLAAILMLWELILVSFAIYKWSKDYIPKAEAGTKKINMQRQPYIYIAFILAALLAIFAVPEARQGLSFLGNINSAGNEEIGSQFILGIRECLINAKYFLLFIFLMILKQNSGVIKGNDLFKYICVLIIAILVIGLRIGTNRKRMLADALAVILLLGTSYPKYKKLTVLSLIAIGVSLVAATTVYRGMIDSSGSFITSYWNIDFFQPYFLGQYNIAIAIEAITSNPDILNIKTFIFEILRPIFGIGAILKNFNFLTAASLFDARMSLGLHGFRGDQILPMIGQGYMYLGLFLSPIFSLLFCRMGIYCDTLYRTSKRLEVTFLSSMFAFYLAQFMILNATIILNILSFRLAIYVPIVCLSIFFSELSLKKTGQADPPWHIKS